ncbi:MAG: HEAT repeat domain-containing protein [Pseudomonadota bacterium]
MSERPQDSPTGYTACDGRYVQTPARTDLPDAPVDFAPFQAAALASARKAADWSYARAFSHLNHALDHAENPMARAVKSIVGDTDPKDNRRTEDILMAARDHRKSRAEAAVDALFNALETPQGCTQFRARLADVIGFGPVAYANGYAAYMEHEHPWVIPLLHALPPARLAAALASLVPPHIFDPHRTWFYEPALERFLSGPHGDLRHLEGPTPVRDPLKSEPFFDVKALMTGETYLIEAAKLARNLRKMAQPKPGDAQAEARAMSDMLGVPVSAKDIEDMGHIGDELRRKLHETRAATRPMPWGGFAAAALRGGLTPRAAAQPARLWAPYVATHLTRFDAALGLVKGPDKGFDYQVKHATALLRHLPATPARYKDTLFRAALGKKKTGRADAQRLLRGTPGLVGRLSKEARKKARDTRLQAAACLGHSGDRAAIAVLEDMLADAPERIVQNAALSALNRLGAKTTAYAPGRAALIAEAEAVFDTPYPDAQRWLADLDLPDLVFDDGTRAPVTLAPWLMRLAAELGLPTGGPLLDLRLAHLDKGSRKTLGQRALDAFVRHDTLRWDDMTAPAHRPRLIEQIYVEYVDFFDWETGYLRENYPQQAKRRRDKLDWPTFRDQITERKIAKFLKEKRNWEPYVTSANDAKGILGLARTLTPGAVKPTLRAYLGEHARRTAQARSLMQLYAGFGGKPVIAELTRIAETQTQNGLRGEAMDLLEDLGAPFQPPPPETPQDPAPENK